MTQKRKMTEQEVQAEVQQTNHTPDQLYILGKHRFISCHGAIAEVFPQIDPLALGLIMPGTDDAIRGFPQRRGPVALISAYGDGHVGLKYEIPGGRHVIVIG